MAAVYCSAASLLLVYEPYLSRAEALLSEATMREQRVAEYFSAGLPLVERLKVRNRRNGVAAEDELWLAPWFLHAEVLGSGDEILCFSRLSTTAIEEHFDVKPYKTEIHRKGGEWVVMKEYGKESAGTLTGLSDEHIQGITEIFPMRVVDRERRDIRPTPFRDPKTRSAEVRHRHPKGPDTLR